MASFSRCSKTGKLYPADHAMCGDCAAKVVAKRSRDKEEYESQTEKDETSYNDDGPDWTEYDGR